jgi:Putative phage tail protein
MSNIGQAVLTVVGTVVGAYFGNPELGFALGSLAGSALFPTQLPNGPQLTDNRTTTASLGLPVPIVFGTASVAGTIIWLGPIITSTTEQGSKGGPQQKLYQYNQSIAIGLSESAVDLQQAIGGMSRVWENGTLVYDIRPQQAADTATGQVAETDEEYAARLTASANYADSFVLYLGTETQEPDPTIQAIEGIDNVQPFLGLAYIVYPNRLLQTSQGWRHPNFQFEIFQSGAGACTDASEYSNSVLYPWLAQGGKDPRDPRNTMDYVFSGDLGIGPVRATLELALADGPTYSPATPAGFSAGFDVLYGWNSSGASGAFSPYVPPAFFSGISGFDATDQQQASMFYNRIQPTSFNFGHIPGPDVQPWLDTHQGGYWIGDAQPAFYEFHSVWYQIPDGDHFDQIQITDNAVLVNRYPSPPTDPCYLRPPAPVDGYCISETGQYVTSSGWTYDTTHTYKVLSTYQSSGARGSVITQVPLNPCLRADNIDYANETFWVTAYNAAVANGTMPSGLVYGTNYPVIQEWAYAISLTTCTGGGSQVSLATIITALCDRAGISDIDVTDMESIFVDGYPISALASAAAAIDPLKSVGFFDSVESGLTIRFQSRGKDIVATLTDDDIGAFDALNAGANIPPRLTVVRSLDSDLPRRIRYHYNSTQRDYQAGEQDSPFRPTSIAVNDLDVSIPIAMGDTQALQAAEIVWADAWNGRTSYSIAVDQAWSELEPGDAIAIPVNGFTERVRITKDQNSGGVLRLLSCVSDDERSYTSTAIAPPPGYQPPPLQLLSQTLLFLMDLPALQDADATAGFYTAVSRLWGSGNSFRGAQLYKSTDGGSTYTGEYAQIAEITYGNLAGQIFASEFYTWDSATIIEVLMPDDSLSFESVTDDAVLAGANAAAVGADGRWEIIQFATATKIAVKTWQLSRLLRGRRGTEHVIGTSQSGDFFVLLASGPLARMALNTSEIGNLDDYKAVSIGASFATGTVDPFTGRAMALKPFSPVDIAAVYQTDGDILITWTRRDKLGRTLMSGVDIPNSESILAFQIDIADLTPNSPETIIRTLTVVNATQAIYTAAEIMADFGSSSPTSLRLDIYQMSAIVGRGTPGHAIIELGAIP